MPTQFSRKKHANTLIDIWIDVIFNLYISCQKIQYTI
jgi:hypothetical protein